MLRSIPSLALSMFVVSIVLSAACGGGSHGPSAPTLPDGKKLAVMVILDHTTPPDTTPEKAAQLQQVAEYWGQDLVLSLQRSGYDSASVSEVDHANVPGRYVLKANIVEYNAGSTAARLFVGFGAGKARLETAYALLGPDGTTSYLKGNPSASTSRTDWRATVRKIDQDIIKAINVRLNQGL